MRSHKTTIAQATATLPTQPSRTHSSPGAKHNGFLSRPFNECWDVPFFAASAFLSTRIAQFVLLLLTLLMASACLAPVHTLMLDLKTTNQPENYQTNQPTNQTNPTSQCQIQHFIALYFLKSVKLNMRPCYNTNKQCIKNFQWSSLPFSKTRDHSIFC